MSQRDSVANNVGDIFLNRCYETVPFFDTLYRSKTRLALVAWSESWPLLSLVLVVLLILPSIFAKTTSLLKISRIYNLTRLGLMSILHQVSYAYSIVLPLRLMVFQGAPCIHATTFGQVVPRFPSGPTLVAAVFCFSIARFTGARALRWRLLIVAALIVLSIIEVCERDSTFLQAFCAIPLAYILHFVSIRVPFRFVHVENAVMALFVLGGWGAAVAHGWSLDSSFNQAWFAWVVVLIDEVILARHHFTRKGFRTVERPFDISWVVTEAHAEAMRLFQGEDEKNFGAYCRSDMLTSVAAFSGAFAGVLVRRVVQPIFFTKTS
jgi:hypothetical protein